MRGVQRVQQLVELERLGDEALDAEAGDFDRLAHRAEPGDDDGDDFRVAGKGLAEDLPAIDARQSQVGDQDVEGKLAEPGERLARPFRPAHLEAVVSQSLGDHIAERGFVVDEQEVLDWGVSHLPSGGGILTQAGLN